MHVGIFSSIHAFMLSCLHAYDKHIKTVNHINTLQRLLIVIFLIINYLFQYSLTPLMPTVYCEFFYSSMPVMLLSISIFITKQLVKKRFLNKASQQQKWHNNKQIPIVALWSWEYSKDQEQTKRNQAQGIYYPCLYTQNTLLFQDKNVT